MSRYPHQVPPALSRGAQGFCGDVVLTGIIPILHSPGLMIPGQLGPINRVCDCSDRIFFTFTMSCCAHAEPSSALAAELRRHGGVGWQRRQSFEEHMLIPSTHRLRLWRLLMMAMQMMHVVRQTPAVCLL